MNTFESYNIFTSVIRYYERGRVSSEWECWESRSSSDSTLLEYMDTTYRQIPQCIHDCLRHHHHEQNRGLYSLQRQTGTPLYNKSLLGFHNTLLLLISQIIASSTTKSMILLFLLTVDTLYRHRRTKTEYLTKTCSRERFSSYKTGSVYPHWGRCY